MATPKYNKSQLSKMVVNPTSKGDMLKEYPRLQQIVPPALESEIKVKVDEYLRNLAWLFDPHSPIVKEFPTLNDRRKVAKDLSGYDGPTNHKMEVGFILKIVQNRRWGVLCVNESILAEFSEQLMTPLAMETGDSEKELKAAEKKIKLREELPKIVSTIDEIEFALFGDDKELIKEAAAQEWSPEDVASMGR